MIRSNDGTQTKRLAGVGDKIPVLGISPTVITYTATGGETSINLSAQTPPISYKPGQHQLKVRRSSGGGELFAGIDYNETSTTAIGFAAGDALIAGEIVEIELKFAATGVMAATPRPDCYTATATTGQTTVAADFSWTYNSFPSKGIGAVRIYLNGVLQTRGVDYTEVNLGTSMTNQITFVDALLGGENISILPTQQVIDDAGASTQFNNSRLTGMQSMISAGTQAFVDQSTDMIAVPNTTIVGRARIPNLANDLRASLGIERIMTQSITLLQNEFGSGGEPVYAAVNDDRGLIRFVGSWASATDTYGTSIKDGSATDYVEIVFYGTGLNILLASVGGNKTWDYYVDGGSIQTGTYPTTGSSVLGARNYASNQVLPVTSWPTPGLHTVRIVTSGASQKLWYGFEILNANASGLVNVNTGTAYANGTKIVKSAASAIAYNTGVTGTKGGRVVRYLNSDGTVGQAVTLVDTNSYTLANTNHTNEEVVRTYHWREFGCGRDPLNGASQAKDDFSSPLASNARAFTLEDGTTTLVSSAVMGSSVLSREGMSPVATNDYITLTFVGTGVDIWGTAEVVAGTLSTYVVSVDGGSEQAMAVSTTSAWVVYKLVSGLPYGTHTVKLKISALNSKRMYWASFIVYGPKKPTIPATAVELCDYNVMADYGRSSTIGQSSIDPLSTGCLFKANSRELVYVGANWVSPLVLNTPSLSGFHANTPTNGEYFEYTFFGTGVEIHTTYNVSIWTASVQVDGVSYSGAATLGYVSTPVPTWTGGVFTTGGGRGASLQISGLTLGAHKVRLTKTTATDFMYITGVSVITPIHAVKSNLYADLQNTLPVGSCSLTDSRKTSMVKEILPAQKAWAQAVGVASGPSTTAAYASPVPMPDMSVTVSTSGGALDIGFVATLSNNISGGGNVFVFIYVNGVPCGVPITLITTVATQLIVSTNRVIVPCAKGVHKVDMYWASSNGSPVSTAYGTSRILTVQEL